MIPLPPSKPADILSIHAVVSHFTTGESDDFRNDFMRQFGGSLISDQLWYEMRKFKENWKNDRKDKL